LDPNIIYGGKITKYDKRTGQVQNISPEPVRSGNVRFIRTAPVIFSPVDNKTLYFSGNIIFKTTNGGDSWETISPDLTREAWDIPASVGIYTSKDMLTMKRRGVVYTLAPSYNNINTLWAGTDDGLIHITRDGGQHWKNITPTEITSWSKVSLIDASRFDDNTAYVAVNRIRCDDQAPYIYKTTDGGATWKKIVTGLPNEPINAVREDAVRKGLLFAGSENAVYVSFDAGEHWQSLQLNMPSTSIRDLVIKDDDLVIGTHGRSFWILDNISSLRQLNSSTKNQLALFKPQVATRIRWNMNTDTPLPPEEPAGENPPDGAMIEYYLPSNTNEVVQIDILNQQKEIVRTFKSNDTLYTIPELNIPLYWIRPQSILSNKTGMHRLLWDMKYAPLNLPVSYPMTAVKYNTAPDANAPWVLPGLYTVRITVGNQQKEQALEIKMDPRVKTAFADLKRQHDLSKACYDARKQTINKYPQIDRKLSALFEILDNTDMAPTKTVEAAVKNVLAELNKAMGKM